MTAEPSAPSEPELDELRAAASGLLAREWSPAELRKRLDADGPAWVPTLWRRVCDLGWPDLLVDPSAGGGGGTVGSLCVLAEAIGASTAPLPLTVSAVAAWCASTTTDPNRLHVLSPDAAFTCTVGARSEVTGAHRLVPYGDVAATMLALACTPSRESVLIEVDLTAPGVSRTPLRLLDRTPAAAIDLHHVAIDRADVLESGPAAEDRWGDAQLRALLATTAELTGVAGAANDAATEYAKQRVAFGRPIGAFQAIKHRLVDQRTAVEICRALVTRAAEAVEARSADAAALASLAAFWAIDSLRAVTEGALQVFGGVGYTWEHDAHIYVRRAAVLSTLLGERAAHRDVVGGWLERRRR